MTDHKRIILILAAIFSCAGVLNAQTKNYTIAEATNGMATTLAPASLKQGSWQPATHSFYFTANEKWVMMSATTLKTDTLLGTAELNRLLQPGDSLKSFPAISWINQSEAWFRAGSKLHFIRIRDKEVSLAGSVAIPGGAEHVTVNTVGSRIAWAIGNNLQLSGRQGDIHPVSSDTDKNILNGSSVHRDEFGISGGIFFSPKGNLLAYYRMDQTMVSDYPVINWNEVPAKVNIIKYPMAGGVSHHVTVNVYHPETQQTVTLNTGEPADHYLTCVSWSPDEKYIFIAVLNREQNHLWLNQYDVHTGEKIKTLFEEKHEKYVEPQHELSFLPGTDDQFIWWSQRDGFMHLYLYSTSGKLIRQLTKGDWVVNELAGFNTQKKEVIITASKETPLEKHSYAVNWTNGKIRRIDTEPGIHQLLVSEDGKYLYDVFNAPGIPRRSVLRSVDGRHTHTLLNAENTLSAYNRPEVRSLVLRAEDGTPLYGRLVLPTGFDSTKKYPVIVYLYNGPHAQLIRNQFPESGNLWYEYMAQRGYIVFSMDGRGSANRGLAFEQAIHRRAGVVEMNDQMKGVEYLRSLPYADASRMGIHGWSYGGFMTTGMMLQHPGVFKAAVAGGPVMDWKMYEVMYTERYMGTPQNNPEGFENANLLSKVKNLKGKLLLIHGTDDDVVVWQHSLSFLKKCVDEGVQVDYFVYPGHQHNVRGKDRVHLMEKITEYFDAQLK